MNAAATARTFSPGVLELDAYAEVQRIAAHLRETVGPRLRRKGAVVAVSGGVDSAVCAALAVRALGRERVFALLLPERDSSSRSTELGRRVCDELGVQYVVEDIAPALEALGCYHRRDEAIRMLFPEFGRGWKSKISASSNSIANTFTLIVRPPEGQALSARMPHDVYLGVVAATNMKQRARKLLEYTHAERLQYAVIGTPNKLEYALGFFVRGGDGLADLKPIAHLYKTQVYALAQALGTPEEIRAQQPSTDTYSLPQTQEEFYFGFPYATMDLLLYAHEHAVPAADVATAMALAPAEVERAYRDIAAKMRIASQLLAPAVVQEGRTGAQAIPQATPRG